MADERLNALLATLPLPTLAIDSAARVIAVNAKATALLGLDATDRHFITVLRQPALVEAVELCLKDATPRTALFLGNERGKESRFDVNLHPVAPRGPLILSFQDVTQMTQAGQMRRDFVANVSHELRTPLTSLMGFIETLRGAARDDPQARERFLSIMSKEAERMNRLVGDLLSLSRLEGEARVRPTDRINLAGVLITTIRNLNPLAMEAHVDLVLDLGSQPMHVLGDGDQLQQVFTNLVENGIKYGGQDQRVTLRARVSDLHPTLRMPAVEVQVQDTGPGIAAEHLPRLTERFYRADNHRSREMGGTGLGLAIVKHIVNRHRGHLRITSEPGQGACFSVTLPLHTLQNEDVAAT